VQTASNVKAPTMITDFFKRKLEPDGTDGIKKVHTLTEPPAKTEAQPLVQIKTVQKWQRDLHDIGYIADKDNNTVLKIWCEVCRDFPKQSDKTSSVCEYNSLKLYVCSLKFK